jgi:hypothetical protein
VTVAAIGDEERHQGTHAVQVGPINNRATVSHTADKPGARQDGDVRGQRIGGAADRFRNCPGQQSDRLSLHQQAKNRKPGGLTQSGKPRQRVGQRHGCSRRRRTDVTNNRKCAFWHANDLIGFASSPTDMIRHFEYTIFLEYWKYRRRHDNDKTGGAYGAVGVRHVPPPNAELSRGKESVA